MLVSDSMLLILIVVMVMVSVLMSVQSAISYQDNVASGQFVIEGVTNDQAKRQALLGFWLSVTGLFSIAILVISSFSLTGEKETGMARFMLAYHPSLLRVYLSRFLVLGVIALLTCVISVLVFAVVFSLMGISLLGIDVLLASMIFPFLIFLAFAALGLLVSSLSSKKSVAVVLAVVVFVLGAMVNSTAMYAAEKDAMATHPTAGYNNYTQYVSVWYQIVIFSYPMALTEGLTKVLQLDRGATYFTELGDALVGLALIFVLFLAGLAWFRWESRSAPRKRRLWGRGSSRKKPPEQ